MADTRIRASVTVTAPVAAVTVSASGRVGVSPGLTVAEITRVVPIANVKWIDIVFSAQVDFRGLNPILKDATVVLDQAGLHLFKNVFDSSASTDENTIVFLRKTPDEPLNTSEDVGYSLERSISDVVDATDDFLGQANIDDDQVMFLVKSLAPEHLVVTEVETVEFGKNLQEPQTAVDVLEGIDLDKPFTEDKIISEESAFHLERSIAESLDAGDEFNAAFQTDDGQVMILSKTLPTEHQNVSDEAVLEAQKVRADDVSVGDELQPFVLGKGIEEPVQTTESQIFDTSKPLADEPSISDAAAVTAGKPLFDVANSQLEGPNLIEDYVQPSYFASQYVGNGGPAWEMSKPLADASTTDDQLSYTMAYNRIFSDLVDATDDFDGQTTAEDDQTMALVKSRSELVATSESQVFFVGLTKADAADFSDALTSLIGKPALDNFLAADEQTLSIGKALEDSATTADQINSFVVAKTLSDEQVTSDDLGVSFQTGRSDSFAVGDTSTRTAGKGLADEAGTGDSGSLRMTDYCDVLYFTDVYVGTSLNF